MQDKQQSVILKNHAELFGGFFRRTDVFPVKVSPDTCSQQYSAYSWGSHFRRGVFTVHSGRKA